MAIRSVERIQMVDLKNQYLKLKPAIDAAIQTCIDTSSFIKGPQVSRFESQFSQYLRVRHVITCANGTDALQIAAMALDLHPGDEVIVPAFTYVAAAEIIGLLRLTPVLVDVDPETFTISPEAIEEAISPKTKLLIPVHLFGQCADMERITAICTAHNLYMIEDAAQSVGATYTFRSGKTLSAGAIGTLGTTSFFPSKNLGCFGDGGAIYTSNDALAGKVKMIANHGQICKYEHEIIGVNSRLDSIQAAVLTEKLTHLATFIEARQQVSAAYDAAFERIEAIKVPHRMPQSTHVFHQYTLRVPASMRDGLKDYLSRKNIPSMVYYPIPMHHQKAYLGIGRTVGDLAVSEALCKQVISLPMHTELSDEQISYISEAVITYFS